MLVSSRTWYCTGSFPSFSLLPVCALQRMSLVCVKDDDDLIKASREVQQSVIEAYTEILHCHYSCWFRCHFLDKDHAIYHAILRRLSAGSVSVSMGSSSDCWYASGVYRVVNFSSTWISLDLSLHGNTEPFGEKSALGVSVNS